MSGRRARARALDRILRWASAAALLVPIAVLATLLVWLIDLAAGGAWTAELWSGLSDSASLVALACAIALPVGVAAAVYLEEYGGRGWWGRVLDVSATNLAAVPSVVYGLLALELFARSGASGSLFVSASCLALVVSPLLILGSREALRSVCPAQREAALALGGARLRVMRHVVLPVAAPRILSAALEAVARALGEAAPLLVLGGLVFGAALPVRIFEWVERAGAGQPLDGATAATMLVLLAIVLGFNGLAMVLRDRSTHRVYGQTGGDS